MDNKLKIFVIHARRTGYGVIRSIKSETKDIYIADTHKTPIFYSKYVKKGFVISDITQTNEADFLIEMIELAKSMNYKESKPLVFTGKDDYLMFFSKNYNSLKEYFTLSFDSDFKRLENSLSKTKLLEFARISGVMVPQTFDNNHSAAQILNKISFPLIVKPAIKNRPDLDVVKAAFRLKVCNSEDELNFALNKLNDIDVPFVVQELIPGDDNELYTMGVFSYRGELKAWSMSKKIRQFPPNTGECSFGKTIYNQSLLDDTKRLMKATGFTGIAQVEYKKYNNKYYLIEINPRVWSWHQINAKCDVNLVKIAADHLVKGNTTSPIVNPSKDEKYWMFLMMDYLHNFKLQRNISFLELFKDFLRSDVKAFFDITDLKPFIVHYYRTIKYFKKVS